MPKIKIDHIISFSSEDPVHVANNILSSDTSKKWKCRTAGEKSAVVVLQLEKASVITGIDIGNEHSAYIEVLATRSGLNDDYKVLLVTSAFMTPLESRQSQNVNKVRMFNKSELSSPECNEKWDRIKIVCTQPFNKHVQFGLSFITFHTSEMANVPTSVQTNIGKFIVRPESPDNLSAGSLFAKRKDSKDEKLIGAAAIREAASSASLALFGSPICKPKLKNPTTTPITKKRESLDESEKIANKKPRNRDELLYSKDEEEPNEKIDKIIEKKNKEAKEKEKTEKEKIDATPKNKKHPGVSKKNDGRESPKALDICVNSPSSTKKKERTHDTDRKRKKKEETERKEFKKAKKTVHTKPFERLLEGVTLVISGIQNPDRANLRTSASAMGARYKPDWNNSCTHLICAFPNTPKYDQVKGKGKIVKKTWIEDCYSQRKRLPWRRYALDKNETTKDESEEEISEEIEQEQSVNQHVDISDDDTDCSDHKEAGSDTEERIAKIQAVEINKNNGNTHHIYNADTDEEGPVHKQSSTLTDAFKNLFGGKKFYLDQTFDDEIYNRLRKYVVAYKGNSVESPTDAVDVIVTMKTNSQSLKEVNSNAICVGPDWVWDCHNNQKLVPMDDYVY